MIRGIDRIEIDIDDAIEVTKRDRYRSAQFLKIEFTVDDMSREVDAAQVADRGFVLIRDLDDLRAEV